MQQAQPQLAVSLSMKLFQTHSSAHREQNTTFRYYIAEVERLNHKRLSQCLHTAAGQPARLHVHYTNNWSSYGNAGSVMMQLQYHSYHDRIFSFSMSRFNCTASSASQVQAKSRRALSLGTKCLQTRFSTKYTAPLFATTWKN